MSNANSSIKIEILSSADVAGFNQATQAATDLADAANKAAAAANAAVNGGAGAGSAGNAAAAAQAQQQAAAQAQAQAQAAAQAQQAQAAAAAAAAAAQQQAAQAQAAASQQAAHAAQAAAAAQAQQAAAAAQARAQAQQAAAAARAQAQAQAQAAAQAAAAARQQAAAQRAAAQASQQASSRAGQGIMSLAQALDDLQYGFNGVLNNIPQILAGFGLGAGLTGVITIATTAVYQLIKHFGTLSEATGSIGKIFSETTPDEERATAMRKWAEAIESTATAYRNQREAIDAAVKAEAAKVAHDQAMRDIARREKERLTGTPQSAADFERQQMADFHGREQTRANQRQQALDAAGSLEAEVKTKEAQVIAKSKEIADQNQRLNYDREIADAKKELERLRGERFALEGNEWGNTEDLQKARAEADAALKKQTRLIDSITKKQSALASMPKGFEATGNVEADQKRYNAAQAPYKDQLAQLEAQANKLRDTLAKARENIHAVFESTGLENAQDLNDTSEKIAAKRKEESIARKTYDLEAGAREQPEAIRNRVLKGLEGLRDFAGDAGRNNGGDPEAWKRFMRLTKEVQKNGELTPELTSKINAEMERWSKAHPKDTADATAVKQGIAAARKYDEDTRATPPPTPPNLEGMPRPQVPEQVQVPGTYAAQENLATVAGMADKAGRGDIAKAARASAADFNDGASQQEIDRLQRLVEQLSKSKDAGVADIARALGDFANAAAAKINSVASELARVKAAQENLKFTQ